MNPMLRFAAVLGMFASPLLAADALNQSCPISGKPVNPACKTVYSKTVALCCNKCKAQFDASPKAYLSNILNAHAGQCPLSKKTIKTPVNVSYKRDVAFCSAECKAKFESAPDTHIREVR